MAMERKFESELGKRISEGKKRSSTINVGIMSAAVVAAALLVGSAAFLLPALGAETGKPVMEELMAIENQDDYLIYVEESEIVVHDDGDDGMTDGQYDVRRIVNLKEKTITSTFSPYYHEYNLFVYNINIVLSDLTHVGQPVGMLVGELEIPYTYADEEDDVKSVSWFMMVNAAPVDVNPATVTLPSVDYQFIFIAVCLPQLGSVEVPIEYTVGDNIQIQVSVKVPFFHDLYPDSEPGPVEVPGVDETAFGEYYDVDDLPVADAGPDQTVTVDTTVEFDGSGSSDGVTDYEWTFVYEDDSEVLIDVAPSFTFGVVGVYDVVLKVTDEEGLFDIDTVTITVEPPNVGPVADAGDDQTVTVGDEVTFDGSGSYDSDGTIVSYEWTFYYGGEEKIFSCIAPVFVFKIVGVYDVTLTVTDDDYATSYDTVTITVEEPPTDPVITA